MPRRMPLSIMTGTRPPTASITSGSVMMLAGTPSICRPPWFDTWMAAAPALIASVASLARSRPFTTTGRPVVSRIMPMSSKVSAVFCAVKDPRPP